MESVEKGFHALNKFGKPINVYEVPEKEISGLETPISYGILRGTDKIFKMQRDAGRDYYEIDHGYFKPGHFSGYYRISLNGMRAKYNKEIAEALPSDRWDELNINIAPWKTGGEYILFCPPTDAVKDFYDILEKWEWRVANAARKSGFPTKIRIKGKPDNIPLEEDLANAICVLSYNSNVMIEALTAGVPVVGFSEDIFNWNGFTPLDIGQKDLTDCDRHSLFKYLSYCQFTLDEFRSGKAWELTKTIQV